MNKQVNKKMNRRGITAIMEQFLIFAIGLVIFAMIVVSFRGIGEQVEGQAELTNVRGAATYVRANIIDVWQAANAGNDAKVERTLSLPFEGKILFEGGEVCIVTADDEECVPVPLDVELEGKAYTLEKFRVIGYKDRVELG